MKSFLMTILLGIGLYPLSAQLILLPSYGFENPDCPSNCQLPNGQLDCVDGWHEDFVTNGLSPLVRDFCTNNEACVNSHSLRLLFDSGGQRITVKADNPLLTANNLVGMPMILSLEARNELSTATWLSISGTNQGPGMTSNDLVELYQQPLSAFPDCVHLDLLLPAAVHNFPFLHFGVATENGNHGSGNNVVIDNVAFCGTLVQIEDRCGELYLRASGSECGIAKPNKLILGIRDANGVEIFSGTAVDNDLLTVPLSQTGVYEIVGALILNDVPYNFTVFYEVESLSDCCTFSTSPAFDIANEGTALPFFLNTTTFEAGCDLVSTHWDFGDGTTCTTPGNCNNGGSGTIFHSYAFCGTYEVCMTVVDECACETTVCRDLVVDRGCEPSCDPGPDVDFDFQIGHSLGIFVSRNVPQSDCPIVSESWDFGDGTSCTNPGDCGINPSPIVLHQFATCGVYNVCLTATDACGCTGQQCRTVVVETNCTGAERREMRPTPSETLRYAPNPFGDHLDLRWSGETAVQLQIFDLRGRLLRQLELAPGAGRQTLSTVDWPRGVYWLQWRSGTQIKTERLVKAD